MVATPVYFPQTILPKGSEVESDRCNLDELNCVLSVLNKQDVVCKDSQKSDLTLAKVDDMMASAAKMLVDDSNKEPWLDSNYVPRVLTDDYKPNGKDEALSHGFEKAVKKLQKGIALDEEDKPHQRVDLA